MEKTDYLYSMVSKGRLKSPKNGCLKSRRVIASPKIYIYPVDTM